MGASAVGTSATGPVPADVADRGGALGAYHPALDGLRTVAVVVTIAYHAQLPIAAGGFLGVSQFFTLSGFLITSLLLRDVERNGRVGLRPFWERRFLRLVPAALLTLVGVLVFGATVADGSQLDRLTGQVVAAALYVVNWFFIWTDQSYGAIFSSPSPVQHFWSLAVEEQFYLLLPLGLVAFFRLGRSLRLLGWVLVAGALASSAWAWWLHGSGASLDRVYFGTDTRAAELLVGAVLAVAIHRRAGVVTSARASRTLAIAGPLALAASCWAFLVVDLSDAFLWSGGMLAFAALSAVVIGSLVAGRGPLVALLGARPLAAVGRVSYGMYLFHWPLLLWLTPERTGWSREVTFGAVLGLAFALAFVSYRFVERPILRLGPGAFARGPVLAAAAVSVLVVVAGAIVVPAARDAADPLATLSASEDGPPPMGDGVVRVLVIPGRGSSGVDREVVRIGGERDDLEVEVAAPLACDGFDEASGTCANWATEWPGLVRSFDPDVAVITANAWPGPDPSGLPAEDAEGRRRWSEGLLAAGAEILAERGATVLWAPVAPADARAAIAENNQPFALAMRSLAVDAVAVRTLGPNPPPRTTPEEVAAFDRAMAELVLDEAAIYERRGVDLPRVLVVGDSIGRSLSWGLERWAAEEGLAVVWSVASDGCGLAEGGVYRTLSGTVEPFPDECDEVDYRWPDQLASFDPDVVVVSSSIWDLSERRLDGWPDFAAPGDARFDEFLLAEYVDAVDELSAQGAEIRWLQAPCVGIGVGGLVGGAANTDALQTEVIEHLNRSILPRLVEARPEVELVDLFPTLCPTGEFERSLGGVEDVRPDGVHFSTEGALWIARERGREILGLDEATAGR